MWVKGPSTMAAYWHQHSRTRSKLVGEWFATGDRYRVDSDGYYTYEGRSDDMMKIGGLWVSPIEIENRLMEHPAVREAAVVQVQIDLDSRIKATVILSEAAQKSASLTSDLQDWCKDDLQRYQYPHVIEFVEDFPPDGHGQDSALQTAGVASVSDRQVMPGQSLFPRRTLMRRWWERSTMGGPRRWPR